VVPSSGADDESERELLDALLRGEPRAQHAAWRRLSPVVHRVLSRLLGPQHDAADAAQEVMIRFFARVDRVRDSSMRSYVVGICYRVASEERRSQRIRRMFGLTQTGAVPEQAFVTDVEGRAALRRLDAALQLLGSRERALFVLRHIEQLELDEVAAALGTSVSTARRQLVRVRGRLLALVRRDAELIAYLSRGEEQP
jgi:RNA polymerase sigma-70 factor (ECF subfamily)